MSDFPYLHLILVESWLASGLIFSTWEGGFLQAGRGMTMSGYHLFWTRQPTSSMERNLLERASHVAVVPTN